MEEGHLVAIAERKFSEFFKKPERFEASGVVYQDGYLYVVFDNLYQVAKIRADLNPKKKGNELLGETRDQDSGYEDIAFNQDSHRFYTLVECAEYPDLTYRAQIHEYDSDFVRRTGGWWLDFNFHENSNKGFEGLAWMKRGARSICWHFARVTTARAARRAKSREAVESMYSRRQRGPGRT